MARMDFIDAAHVLRRRWWMFLVGMVLVSGGVLLARSLAPVQYQASGLMLVLLPAEAPEGNERVNPYLNLPEGLTTTASLIASEAVSDDVAAEIVGGGHTALYSVALVPDTGPLLTITAKDTDPGEAVSTRDALMDWINRRLVSIQEPVSPPPSQVMYTTSTSVSTTAEVLPGSRVRAMAGAAAGGLVLLLVVIFLIDRVLLRRAASRAATDGEVDEDPGGVDEDEGGADEDEVDEDDEDEEDEDAVDEDEPGEPHQPHSGASGSVRSSRARGRTRSEVEPVRVTRPRLVGGQSARDYRGDED
jgi:capsular polysaccharide biosynthesis protein